MTKLISIILIITLINSPLIKGVRGLFNTPLVPMLCVGTEGIAFASDKITPYPPETKQTPAIEEVKEEKGGVSWLWVILGIVAVGGIAAAAGGGGKSDSGSSGGGGGGGSTGTTTVTW